MLLLHGRVKMEAGRPRHRRTGGLERSSSVPPDLVPDGQYFTWMPGGVQRACRHAAAPGWRCVTAIRSGSDRPRHVGPMRTQADRWSLPRLPSPRERDGAGLAAGPAVQQPSRRGWGAWSGQRWLPWSGWVRHARHKPRDGAIVAWGITWPASAAVAAICQWTVRAAARWI
jgi:hypothetical protein